LGADGNEQRHCTSRVESVATEPVDGYHSHGENCTTVQCRWPILQKIETAIPECSVCAEVDGPQGRFLVYGAIITYANDRGPDGTSKRWVEHRRAIQQFGADWLRLRSDYAGHPLIVAGDFNQSRDGSGWYEDRVSLGALSEALAVAGLSCMTEQDFRATHGITRASIDHICATGPSLESAVKVGAWEGTMNGRRLSDHNGVYVEFAT
jgi:hypothetical protein